MGSEAGQEENTRRARIAAALRPARAEAYQPSEDIGQENYLTAGEILALARAAGVGPGAQVLDLCCGNGSVAVHLIAQTGCRIVGTDLSLPALRLARAAAGARQVTGQVAFLVADASRPPLNATFDVVLLLETMLSIEDKARLLQEVRRLLRPGSRFALTLEAGRPMSEDERRLIPSAEPIWLIPEDDFLALLQTSGFRVKRREDYTARQADLAGRLARAIDRHRRTIAADLGDQAARDLCAFHGQFATWLSAGRLRKLVMVVEKEG